MFKRTLVVASGLLAASTSSALRADDFVPAATQDTAAIALVASADVAASLRAESDQTSAANPGVSARRLNAAAAQGPDALRRFIYMTQAIYAHDMQRHLASDDAP
ncbi:hypothetical protein [Niveibacterium microcysteis]|uniref:DUF4142 domain-containing protein n=1 Tax=Niveibacterium microcysteis TaxID=2811415 RepID=A0ABX7M441_9RHOO|nr:hypothetical protein [Niveibacterium microcysteis]QSI76512.1 hypothetical protein JY500_18950 [Niveibacterium microcysteis]